MQQLETKLGVYEKELCPTVIRPDTPVWILETMKVDFKLLQIKTVNKIW